MECINIIFDEYLSLSLIEEFEKKIYFISEEIFNFERIIENDVVVGLKLFINDISKSEQIKNTANNILHKEIIGLRDIQNKKIWETENNNKADGEKILNDLLRLNLVHIHGEGQIGFKEPLVELFNIFDMIFKKISMDIFNGENYRFPTLLKNTILKKVGYFDSFPNLLMFTTRLKNEVSNYENFKAEFNNEDNFEQAKKKLLEYCCIMDYALPPTMCYYVYDMLSNKKIENQCITARGKSFRFENRYYKPFERLWDFTIRETVFLGDFDYVKRNVNSYKLAAIQVAELIGLDGFCETANDPFFLTDNTTNRVNVQKMYGSKYELRLNTNQNHTIAVGSFNLHGQFLSKKFNLFSNEPDQKYIFTGCIGIGLERFMFSFLSQYGVEVSKWPQIVVDLINNIYDVNKIIGKVKDKLDV